MKTLPDGQVQEKDIVYRDADARTCWLAHVKRTPPGMVPVLINGTVPAYQSAMGTDFAGKKILNWFLPFNRRFWPDWAKRWAEWALEESRTRAVPA